MLRRILGHGAVLDLRIADGYVFVREPRGGFVVHVDGGVPELLNEDGAAIMQPICMGGPKARRGDIP